MELSLTAAMAGKGLAKITVKVTKFYSVDFESFGFDGPARDC